MQWFKSRTAIGALMLAGAMLTPAYLSAQSRVTVTLTIEDSTGAALRGATVSTAYGRFLGHSDEDGRVTLDCAAPCRLVVTAQGFSIKTVELSAGATLRLQPAVATSQVTVTAYRTPLGTLESPVTTRILSQEALATSAALTFDGQLRQLPGVELFRRSSSLVANPSSQGISLRGLGSTSASRTLIVQDDVPLNDPVGGWIHWQEQPELALKSVEVMRGGGSDLYGSSAIGGVVSLIPARPAAGGVELRSSYGNEGTYDDSLLLQGKRGPWGVLGAGGLLGTDGYIQEAPWQRGPVDIPSTVHSHNGMLLAERDSGPLRLFVRGSGFNESRGNGTPYQNNGTRLWRYSTGSDSQGPRGAVLALRVYGAQEHFRQTFSQISNPGTLRNGETPTKLSLTPDNELGAAAHWNQPLGAGLLLLAGADVHDVRVWDLEQSFGSAATTDLHVHQRDSAGYAEAMWVRKAWTLTASARMDWFQNYDGRQLTLKGSTWAPSAKQPVQFDQRVFDPRLGLSRKLFNHWAVSASGFRAFRAPTPNELYRSTQVGNKLTFPNGSLLSERATGWEAGLATEWPWGSVRSSYFMTQVNRPIVAVTLDATASPITLKRQNLGQIESQGLAIDFQVAPRRWLAVDGGYQFAHATVTKGPQDIGNWIPEVAHNMASMNVRAYRPKLGTVNVEARLSGRQYDDDANLFLLHGYFRMDAYGSHDFGKRLQVFTAGENLLDRQIEVAKTPTSTLAMPRVARVGFLVRLGGDKP
jgi:outer membrane receptor protein involved in Fe transport